MRQETEHFEDGKQTIRTYDSADRLCCIETITANGQLQAAIDYIYDAAGVNVERIVRDGAGIVLRRMFFDATGNELNQTGSGEVRWAAMDGSDEGVDLKGQEQLGDKNH